MTKELYVKQFGKMSKVSDYDQWVKSPDAESALKGRRSDRQLNNASPGPVENNFAGKKIIEKKTIYIKATNNKFICDDESKNDLLFADRDRPDSWETFSLIRFEKDQCAIQSNSGHFLSVEIGSQKEITATRTAVAGWETFTMIHLENNLVAFKAVNGNYVSVDEKNLQLFATENSIGRLGKFELIEKK